MRRFPSLSVVALLAAAGTSAIAQTVPQSVVTRLDSIAAAPVVTKRAVGLAGAVVRGNDTLLLKGYGKADVEADAAMPADAVFPVGSITKQFTAAAILQLRDAGKLSLDDEITKWLPDFDTRGNRVTLRHMLGHTSGIADLTSMPELRGLVRDTVATRDSAYRAISHYAFQFPTGTMQVYSSSNFFLLGLIIEKASGGTYEDYIEKKIFAPLGMARSSYCNNTESVPRRALGYALRNGATRRAPSIVHTWPYAAGSVCSTAPDLVTWMRALHGGKVLTPKSYAEMTTPSRLEDGTLTRYGMGIVVAEDSRGLKYVGHDGGINAFSSDIKWYPEAKLAVVVLTNSAPSSDPVAVGEDLAAAVLSASRIVKPFDGDASPLAGTYKGTGRRGEMVVEVSTNPQGISFSVDGEPANALSWVSGRVFRYKGALLTFRASPNGSGASELHFDTAGDHFILRRR